MFRNRLLNRMSVSLVLAIGISVAWGFVVLWGMTIYSASFPTTGTYQRVVFASDGTPVIESSTYYATQPSTYSDLEGREYTDPDEDWQNSRHMAGSLNAIIPGREMPLSAPHTRMFVFRGMNEPATFWYFIHSGAADGGGWFEGYSSATRRLTGYIGVHGPTVTRPEGSERFRVAPGAMTHEDSWSEQNYYRRQGVPIPQVIVQFPPGRLNRTVCVPVADNILIVDLRDGSVRTLMTESHPVHAIQVTLYADRRNKEAQILVQTNESVRVFSEKLDQRAEFRLPADFESRYFSFLTATDGTTWVVGYQNVTRQGGPSARVLHWSTTGELLSQREVKLSRPAETGQDAWFAAVSVAVPSPITLTATVFGFAPYAMWNTERVPWSEAVARCFAAGAGPALAIVWLLGAAAALLTWRHSRREDTPAVETIFWTAFALLLGPAAYLGYRFHRRWPRQLPCPAGGHTLPADHFDCPTCHTPWPLPAMKGIEVLEPAEA